MSDELFEVPEQLSPRLKWMREHAIKVYKSDVSDALEPWIADSSRALKAGTSAFSGATEDEAIVELAKANGWKLWNEL